jgi:hypothetical protein
VLLLIRESVANVLLTCFYCVANMEISTLRTTQTSSIKEFINEYSFFVWKIIKDYLESARSKRIFRKCY